VWRETTWRELADRVAAVALGLASECAVARGERVAIIGDPCPEWTIADLAVQALGGVSYGVYPTSSPSEVRYLLQHGGAAVVVVEDQEHLDKTLAVLDDCPAVRAVLVVDTRALFTYRHPRVRPFGDVERAGRTALTAEPGALARLAAAVRPDDPAVIIYTSGTTGSRRAPGIATAPTSPRVRTSWRTTPSSPRASTGSSRCCRSATRWGAISPSQCR
jgi:long-chain acyl-CoA synthetase